MSNGLPLGMQVIGRPFDEATVLRTASRAGLKLNDYQTAILLETAPYALAKAERMRKPRDRMEEPTLVFRFPN